MSGLSDNQVKRVMVQVSSLKRGDRFQTQEGWFLRWDNKSLGTNASNLQTGELVRVDGYCLPT